MSAQHYRRVVSNLGSQLSGVGVTIAVQLALVPVFLAAWGAVRYGEWIVLTSLPMFFRLAECGLVQAAAAPMTHAVVQCQADRAFQLMGSVQEFLSISFGGVTLLLIGLVMLSPLDAWLELTHFGRTETGLVVLLMAMWAWVAASTHLAATGFQSLGDTARGIYWLNSLRVLEALLCGILVWFVRSAAVLAIAVVVARGAVAWIMSRDLRRLAESRNGLAANVAQTGSGGGAGWRNLLRPGIGFMGYPVAHAFLLPGLAFVVQTTLGAPAVVVFSTARTLARMLVQGAALINSSIGPEYSRLLGGDESTKAVQLYRTALHLAFGVAVVGGGVLLVAGPWMYRHWTHRSVDLSFPLWMGMVATAALAVMLAPAMTVLRATNQHARGAVIYAVAAAAMAGLALPLSAWFGVAGVAWAAFGAEAITAPFVLGDVRRLFRAHQESGNLSGGPTAQPNSSVG